MFGITNPTDAITIGTILAAAILTLFGRKVGDAAKEVKQHETVVASIGTAFADKDLMTRLVLANEDQAKTMKTFLEIQTDKHERAVEDLLKRIDQKLPG